MAALLHPPGGDGACVGMIRGRPAKRRNRDLHAGAMFPPIGQLIVHRARERHPPHDKLRRRGAGDGIADGAGRHPARQDRADPGCPGRRPVRVAQLQHVPVHRHRRQCRQLRAGAGPQPCVILQHDGHRRRAAGDPVPHQQMRQRAADLGRGKRAFVAGCPLRQFVPDLGRHGMAIDRGYPRKAQAKRIQMVRDCGHTVARAVKVDDMDWPDRPQGRKQRALSRCRKQR